ncbi:hypothetical protein GCM10009664_72990 [Kitasatospora gansuensis]
MVVQPEQVRQQGPGEQLGVGGGLRLEHVERRRDRLHRPPQRPAVPDLVTVDGGEVGRRRLGRAVLGTAGQRHGQNGNGEELTGTHLPSETVTTGLAGLTRRQRAQKHPVALPRGSCGSLRKFLTIYAG